MASLFNPCPIKTISVGEDADEQKLELDFLIEPDATTVFNVLMPRYLETVVFDAMLQSLTSEHASRRMAMKGATDAAGLVVFHQGSHGAGHLHEG